MSRKMNGQPQHHTLQTQALYVLSGILLLFSLFFGYHDAHAVAVITLFIVTLILTILCERRNIFHICMMGSHYAFWIYPIIVLHVSGIYPPIFPLALCVYGLILSLYLTAGSSAGERHNHYPVRISPSLYMLVFTIVFFLMILTSGISFLYTILILIISFALFIDKRSLVVSLLAYTSVVLYVSIYSYYYWNGMGRLVVFGCILVASLILANNHKNIPIGKWVILFLMGFGSFAGSFYRFGGTSFKEVVQESLKDSNISPLVLLTTIYTTAGTQVASLRGWLDQLLLFFTIGFPRELWPSKPLGFGYEYTVDNLEEYLAQAGHSVAATYVGEHIYYLGSFYSVFGVTLSVILMAYLYRFLCRKSILGGYGTMAVAIWLPTFYWNGMASFSARFSLSAAPLILLYIFHRAYYYIRYNYIPLKRRAL